MSESIFDYAASDGNSSGGMLSLDKHQLNVEENSELELGDTSHIHEYTEWFLDLTTDERGFQTIEFPTADYNDWYEDLIYQEEIERAFAEPALGAEIVNMIAEIRSAQGNHVQLDPVTVGVDDGNDRGGGDSWDGSGGPGFGGGEGSSNNPGGPPAGYDQLTWYAWQSLAATAGNPAESIRIGMQWLFADGLGLTEALKLEWLNSIWPHQVTDYTTRGHFSGDFTTSVAAFGHYVLGNGAPMTVDFSKVIPTLKEENVPVIQYLKNSTPNGSIVHINNETWSYNTAREAFWTSGLYIGHTDLTLNGVFAKDFNGAWSFHGTINGGRDIYDGNASTHRPGWAEALTAVIANVPGTPYAIDIVGQHQIGFTSGIGTWVAP